MKYRDLVHFDPIQDVIQLRLADDHAHALHLVETYVISDRMAEVLTRQVFPLLQLGPGEKGGILIVGNYGTGKSHLMSVLSALAEDANMPAHLRRPTVAQAAQAFAGRYRVIRQEIGATNQPLRDILLGYLHDGLAQMGVEVHFPSMDEVPNNKDLLARAMEAFHTKYPNQGLLLVIDELLDYLNSRDNQQLFVDLAFLRELGESCATLNLRFIAGLQEALFDNPRFRFAGDAIRRVRDRFAQVRIVREDVAYVVAHRLLAKDDAQRQAIRQYLSRFAHRYGDMASRMDAFVDLFPVHPAYLEVLEQITLVEKRQALTSISRAMHQLLDQTLPDDHPGLISFDAYWQELVRDPSLRTEEAVRETVDKAKVLEERIATALKEHPYLAPARRIIHALAVYRLATGDVHVPIGLTPEDLRDKLCLFIPDLPEDDAEFLLTSIRSVLDHIVRAVSGQFISHNTENDQFYLDLHKDVDYDARIREYMETLGRNELDGAYAEALKRQLELTDSPYVPGFPIWWLELPWEEHGVNRDGYLFLGHPHKRSTAQPERDFYVYFLVEVFSAPVGGTLPDGEDEVFFRLTGADEIFDDTVRQYAAATRLADQSTGAHRQVYRDKAEAALRDLGDWLRDHALQAFTVRYRGEEHTMSEWLGRLRLSLRERNFRDRTLHLAGRLLEVWFREKYPHYPIFRPIHLTTQTLPSAADAALRVLAGSGPRSTQAITVLEGLGLAQRLDGEVRYTVEQSPYANDILRRLSEREVLNRSELLVGPPDRLRMAKFGLEPPLLAVVLAALIRQGLAEARCHGKLMGADDLGDIARMGAQAFADGLNTVSRPRQLPQKTLEALFEEAGLPVGLVRANHLDEAVQALVKWALQEQEHLHDALEILVRQGMPYADAPALPADERTQLERKLSAYREFVDRLAAIKRPGQLHRLPWGEGEVRAFFNTRRTLQGLLNLRRRLETLNPLLAYLRSAYEAMPPDHPWRTAYLDALESHRRLLADPERRRQAMETIQRELEALRQDYIEHYLKLHARHRLDYRGADERGRLAQDPRWRQLHMLQKVDILPDGAATQLAKDLENLQACPTLTAGDLQATPFCPECHLQPRDAHGPAAQKRLEELAEKMDTLYHTWVEVLQNELRKPEVQESIAMLGAPWSEQLQDLAEQGELPAEIDQGFVEALNDVLRGLEKVTVEGGDVLLALTQGGPAAPEALLQRLKALLEEKTRGHDRDKVRILIEW